MRVLILGGTTEASGLAHLLAADPRFETTLSLAGRTSKPRTQPVRTRIGGFGGADGLAAWLAQEAIEATVDATHPYADQISSNAVAACERLAIPLATILRPAWQPKLGDQWNPRHHYIARTIDPPEGIVLPRDARLIFDRGPFDEPAETALLMNEKIDVLVSKNSGGAATYAKITAARKLGIPVVMIARPHKSHGHVVDTAEAAAKWLEKRLAHRAIPGSARGV